MLPSQEAGHVLSSFAGGVRQKEFVNMIFGFNTDIKSQGTVYHVQTEVREQEHRLESQVFVRGRCVGKRSASLPPDAAEEDVQELARAQHRWVVDAVREGFVNDVLKNDALKNDALKNDVLRNDVLRNDVLKNDAPNSDSANQDSTQELVVHFLGSHRISDDEVILRFRVLLGGFVASAAQVSARWTATSSSGVMESTVTDDAGVAEMRLVLSDGTADLEVRALAEGKNTCRRFLVKSAKI
jgi:hypothetical protein